MSFISYEFIRSDLVSKRYLFTLTDSEFGCVEIGAEYLLERGLIVALGSIAHGVANEYSRRNLPVGRNLALLVIFTHKRWGNKISTIEHYQDEYCCKRFANWGVYARERQEHLVKLLALI